MAMGRLEQPCSGLYSVWRRSRSSLRLYEKTWIAFPHNVAICLPTRLVLRLEQTCMVFAEAMPVYPRPVIVARRLLEDIHFVYGRTSIPSDLIVNFNLFALHRRSDTWENPNDFDFTRWERSNKWYSPGSWLSSSLYPTLQRTSFRYAPFGTGPRCCTGASFTALEG